MLLGLYNSIAFKNACTVILLFAFFCLLFPSKSISKKRRPKKAVPTRPILKAGNILVQLPLQRKKHRRTRGKFAFTEIKVFNRGRGEYAQGEIDFVAKGGSIHSIVNLENGRNLLDGFFRRKQKRATIKIRRLKKDKPQIFWVELLLDRPVLRGVSGAQGSRLGITLRVDRDGLGDWVTDSKSLEWKIANCGSSYHKALTFMGNKSIPAMQKALKQINGPGQKLSGKWSFSPTTQYETVRETKKICTRRKLRRNRETGKYYKRCVATRNVTRTRKEAVKRPEEEQAFLTEASHIISAKGIDLRVESNAANYQYLKNIFEDLKRYMSQKVNPALCTGAIEMTEYYENKFASIKTRQEKLKSLYDSAYELAFDRGEQFLKVIADRRRPLVVRARIREKSLEQEPIVLNRLLFNIVVASGDEEAVSEVQKLEGIALRLQKFKLGFKSYSEALKLDGGETKQLREVLTFIEAAYYLHRAYSQYENIIDAYTSSLSGIRTLHGVHCHCVN